MPADIPIHSSASEGHMPRRNLLRCQLMTRCEENSSPLGVLVYRLLAQPSVNKGPRLRSCNGIKPRPILSAGIRPLSGSQLTLKHDIRNHKVLRVRLQQCTRQLLGHLSEHQLERKPARFVKLTFAGVSARSRITAQIVVVRRKMNKTEMSSAK